MAVLAEQLTQNVLGRITVILDSPGTATLEIDEIADPVTGTAITVLDSTESTVTFPDSLTQMPGNDLVWFSQQYIIQTAGTYIVDFDPDTGDNFSVPLTVAAGTVPAPSLQTCDIEDHVVDTQGNALENITVSARILAPPQVQSGAGVAAEIVTAQTDSNGFFRLTLLRSVTADVIIPDIGYRRTILVPDAAQVNLFSIT